MQMVLVYLLHEERWDRGNEMKKRERMKNGNDNFCINSQARLELAILWQFQLRTVNEKRAFYATALPSIITPKHGRLERIPFSSHCLRKHFNLSSHSSHLRI